jgi:hypothetical protein
MAEQAPSMEEWSNLYEIMKRVKKLTPWEWMEEVDLFGVQDPESNQIGFVSVTGRMDEHYGVFIYLGDRGLYGFWEFQHHYPDADPMKIFEIPHLQASLGDQAMLAKEDQQIIKQLDLKFRGRNAWPQFRSVEPGHHPWFLESEEVRFLTHALTQLLDVAKRFKEDDSLLDPKRDDEYLVRIAQRQEDGYYWEDKIMLIPPPEPELINIPINLNALNGLLNLPVGDQIIDVDFFIVPSPVEGEPARPVFPYMLLIVDDDSGLILGNKELMAPKPSINEMVGLIPSIFVQTLARAGIRPRMVRVRPGILENLLDTLVDDLKFELETASKMEKLDQAKKSLLKSLAAKD